MPLLCNHPVSVALRLADAVHELAHLLAREHLSGVYPLYHERALLSLAASITRPFFSSSA